MIITAVRTHVLEAKLSQPFAYSRAWYDTRTAMVVEIETDTGLTGWGECYGPARITAAVIQSVAPWVVGADPAADGRAVADDLRPAARSRAKGRGHPRLERHRHRALGHQGEALRRPGLSAARRAAANGSAGLCDRPLSAEVRRPASISGRGGSRLRRGGLQGGEAEGRLRRRARCRRDARRARGDRTPRRADG